MFSFDGIEVVVFDFDGTLVESNEVKRAAFFQLFDNTNDYSELIEDVLADSNAKSRYEVIETILVHAKYSGNVRKQQEKLVAQYSAMVLSAVKECPEIDGATQLLERLAMDLSLYLSSMTPENVLKEIIQYRNMSCYFKAVYGYPRRKEDTLKLIMQKEHIKCDELLVIGDGESDLAAAKAVNCNSYILSKNDSLRDLLIALGGADEEC